MKLSITEIPYRPLHLVRLLYLVNIKSNSTAVYYKKTTNNTTHIHIQEIQAEKHPDMCTYRVNQVPLRLWYYKP